ncbi:MAG: aerolysin family beta-barrel pore-forming toxin, partial [Bacillota bacterium]|nr:aerolysin family beta-barrel pore-forming toxin [Bacillota bacterium]
VDGKTYYDIYDGKSTRGTTEDRIRFLKDVIQSKPEGSDKSVLESWAQLATNIFNRHAYIAAQQHEGNFENNFLNESGERAGYAYLPKRLAALQKWEKGERDRDDYTIATGLKMANSLNEVRTETAQSLIEPLNTSYSANDILKNTNGDATLDALKDDKDQDVLYNLVTCIDQTGQTPKFTYTVFGLAFYDFQLHPLTAEGLEYITAAEGYDSLEQAAQSGAKGVTYITPADSQNTVVSYFENGAEKEATASMQFSQSDSVSVSNSLENTTSYTYTETIGTENKLAATLGIFAETVLKLEFAAQQAISTAYSEEKSISKSKTNDISAEIELPAHTAAAIESSDGSASVTIDYNCPVVVTYKVAIFSLSGDIYQDLVWTKSMSTARYSQGYLQTVFGSKSVKGGMTAQENLYNRAIKYADTSSYEDVYGQTYGWKDMHQDNASATTMRGLDWSGILDGQGLSEADIIKPTVNIKVECYEVDEDGKVLDDKPFNSYTYGGKGYWEYTMPVTAVEKYHNLDKKKFDYTIFTGKTDPGVEATLDNEGRDPEINAGLTKNKSSGLWQKEFTPTHDPTTGEKLTTV